MNLYVMYDTVAKEASPVNEAKNDAVAERQFQHTLSTHQLPSDFILLRVGKINKETGRVTGCVPEEVKANLDMEIEDDQ